ncbi:hypothetical protein BS47DRAFT_1401510 [Hydnum rufescens UP504]|uniref:Uncharacterized protein n=1 Tax=Hydnum rufescens UP504 TaxID=1448309 RepID=A0A9P6AEF0_9AGAM|nr:hypothetical protein BS47DRAFT_1401510 [Hydnum rufescens UP504]
MTIQFYRRLFVINTKQAYIDGQNLCKLASCQKQCFDDAVAKLDEAEGALDRLGIPIDEIQTAWAKQLSIQQAEPPLPKKDAGMKTIKSILNLLWTCTTLRRQIMLTSSQQVSILLHDPSSPDCVELLDCLDQLRLSLEWVESQLAKKEYDLLLHGKMMQGNLEKIKSSQWYNALVCAHAHYQRLVAALISCKFTITQRIEDYRSHILDHKARIHEVKVDKKRQPAIIRCLDQLNKEIECMLDAWDDAPRGAICPEKLDQKGLFSLDVDGAIWKGLHILEAGLGDNRAPPRWLADENMRVAIIAYLDWKGCHAKLDIIKREVANMHVWYAEEHDAIQMAIHEARTDSALRFHLLHKFTDLNNLGELWDHSLS